MRKNRSQTAAAAKRRRFIDELAEMMESIIFSVFIVILVFTFLFRMSTVEGPSMQPTLYTGDRLIASHLFYTPENGDVIIIESGALKKRLVKRVIALENQEINIDFESGKIYVDGEELNEQVYTEGAELTSDYFINEITQVDEGGFTYPLRVPKGCVFVMGDNRNNSTDSRNARLGCVPVEEITGKVIFRIYPFTKLGTIK